MNDEEFGAALRHLQRRTKEVISKGVSFQQRSVETRLRAAGVGERTLDARKLAGRTGFGGGVTLAGRSATATVGVNVGTRARSFQASTIKGISVQAESAPDGGPITVVAKKNGEPITDTGTHPVIPNGETEGFAGEDRIIISDVQTGDWFTFDIESVGAVTPGGRVYVAIEMEGSITRGGMD